MSSAPTAAQAAARFCTEHFPVKIDWANPRAPKFLSALASEIESRLVAAGSFTMTIEENNALFNELVNRASIAAGGLAVLIAEPPILEVETSPDRVRTRQQGGEWQVIWPPEAPQKTPPATPAPTAATAATHYDQFMFALLRLIDEAFSAVRAGNVDMHPPKLALQIRDEAVPLLLLPATAAQPDSEGTIGSAP